ncbi:MAG: DUF1320 domain-containing protein [Thermodesulfovibrionia bacterium]|nr:DUF1320 domain-containing protein [Thermodesulfovibrionia bacterium]
MAYSTESDILALEMDEKTLIQLTSDDKTGEVDDSKVTAAILKADTVYVDPYCRDRYVVPFSPVPDEIMFISSAIASYYLFRRKQKVSSSTLDKYIKAVAKLKDISEGKYTLEGATEISDSSGIASTTEGEGQTFERTKTDSSGNIISTGSMDPW